MRALVALVLAASSFLPATLARADTQENERIVQYIAAEEAMAADLYAAFDEVYVAPQFTRIAGEERGHLRLIRRLLATPMAARAGDYSAFPGLEQDYWAWLATGYRDLASAAQVGVAVERRHAAVLDAAIAVTRDDAMLRALKSVRRDDQRHLVTFMRLMQSTPPAQACSVPGC